MLSCWLPGEIIKELNNLFIVYLLEKYLAPENYFLWVRFIAGLPHISNLIIKSVTNNFLAALSSNKKSFHDLKSRNILPLDIFLKAMAVSIVVMLHPSITPACLSHLSDWLMQACREKMWIKYLSWGEPSKKKYFMGQVPLM